MEEPPTCSGSKQMCGGMFGDVTRLDSGRKAEEEKRKAEEAKRIAEAELKATERSLEEAKKAKEAADRAAQAESIEDGNLKEKAQTLEQQVDKITQEKTQAESEIERLRRENQQLRDEVSITKRDNAEKDKAIAQKSAVQEQQQLSINAKTAQIQDLKNKEKLGTLKAGR